MTADEIAEAVRILRDAEEASRPIEPLTTRWPDLDLATAYAIQDRAIAERAERGDQVVGVKLGLTSQAKQRAMNVDQPLTAWLTARMDAGSGVHGVPPLAAPRIEPEIVFVLGERLEGPGLDGATALGAVAEVRAGLEVIDSRYRDFRFTLPDVVADNASSARFVIGEEVMDPSAIDLVNEGCELLVDGEVVARATGSAVLGDPAEALAFAANVLAQRGLALEPGWIVLTGGLTDAVRVSAGSVVTARFTHLGELTLAGDEI